MTKIALVTLMKNHSDLTMALIDSINTNENYDFKYLTIWIADTGSEQIEKDIIKQYISKIHLDIHYIEYDYYNFAKINNDIIKNHVDKDTELICLLNNDVQLINNAITKAVNVYNKFENIGTVGSLLLYPNFTIQHGGIALFYNDDDFWANRGGEGTRADAMQAARRGINATKDYLSGKTKYKNGKWSND